EETPKTSGGDESVWKIKVAMHDSRTDLAGHPSNSGEDRLACGLEAWAGQQPGLQMISLQTLEPRFDNRPPNLHSFRRRQNFCKIAKVDQVKPSHRRAEVAKEGGSLRLGHPWQRFLAIDSCQKLLNDPGASAKGRRPLGEVEQFRRRDPMCCRQFQDLPQRLHPAQLLGSQRDLQQEVGVRAGFQNEGLMAVSLDQRTGPGHLAIDRKRSQQLVLDFCPADLGPHDSGQYVARPPERSYTAPVENEHSSEDSHATSAATSSGLPTRPIGIFATSMSTVERSICWSSSVPITAGATALTRIPWVATSLASALVSPMTPALAVEYGTSVGLPSLPAMEAMLTMRPLCRGRMSLTAARQTRKTLVRSTAITCCQSA